MSNFNFGIFGVVFTLLIFCFAGLACLIWPSEIQRYWISFDNRHLNNPSPWFRLNPWRNFMSNHSYIITLRLTGLILLVTTVSIAIIIIKCKILK